jgi:hypothetical protein
MVYERQAPAASYPRPALDPRYARQSEEAAHHEAVNEDILRAWGYVPCPSCRTQLVDRALKNEPCDFCQAAFEHAT